jgi:hypothetical protein
MQNGEFYMHDSSVACPKYGMPVSLYAPRSEQVLPLAGPGLSDRACLHGWQRWIQQRAVH